MKKYVRKSACFLAAFSMLLVLLCSCGSELDGTWRSCEDEDTRIKISGEKVRITYDDFRIDGTYEMDDSGNIIFHLTDKNGNKYKIEAKFSTDQKNKRLTLTNAKGESEVFER